MASNSILSGVDKYESLATTPASGTLTTGGNIVTFGTVVANIGGQLSGGNTFTALEPGYYNIASQVDVTGSFGVNSGIGLFLAINGTIMFSAFQYAGSTSQTELTPDLSVRNIFLNAGDTVAMQAGTVGSIGSPAYFNGNAGANFFSISKI